MNIVRYKNDILYTNKNFWIYLLGNPDCCPTKRDIIVVELALSTLQCFQSVVYIAYTIKTSIDEPLFACDHFVFF